MIITGIIEGTNSNHQCYPGAPFVSEPYNQHIQNKKLKEHKGKPIASLHCPQLMEKEWWRSQKKQEDKRRHQLHHHLMPNNWHERALGYRFKQPTADKEETRQTKKDKHSIITHSGITKAEIAYMRKNHENHRESPHRIDVAYPFRFHSYLRFLPTISGIYLFAKRLNARQHPHAKQVPTTATTG